MRLTQLQCPMGCHGHHAILCNPNRFIFVDNIFWYLVVPLNNFESMSYYPWVQGKSNKSPLPPPHPGCVCGGGCYSMLLPQPLVTREYAMK